MNELREGGERDGETTRRARISDKRRDEYLELIARQNAIVLEVQAIMTDLDSGALGYHMRRFAKIVRMANATREDLIAQLEREKAAAKNGRSRGQGAVVGDEVLE